MSLHCWKSIVTGMWSPGNPLQTPSILSQKASACSCLAMYYHDAFQTSKDVEDMNRACVAANAAIRTGLTSPATLTVTYAAQSFYGEIAQPYLREAYHTREKEVEQRRAAIKAKVAALPNRYQCAESACPTKTTSAAPLRKCAGSEDVKPYYHRRKCQWKVCGSFISCLNYLISEFRIG